MRNVSSLLSPSVWARHAVFVVFPRVSPTRYKALHWPATVTILFIASQPVSPGPGWELGIISFSQIYSVSAPLKFRVCNVETVNIQISMFAKFSTNN